MEVKPECYDLGDTLLPDVYLLPSKIWEIGADSITRSPTYSLGKEQSQQGFSLRFPRFIREREDKMPTVKIDEELLIDLN